MNGINSNSGEENNSNVKISDLVKQLESEAMQPSTLSQSQLLQCAWFLKNRGYTNGRISEIVSIHEKTLQRYFRKIREELPLTVGGKFQWRLLAGFLNGTRLRYQRALELSYSDGLSVEGQLKAIMLLHHMEKDCLDTLEKFGYLDKAYVDDLSLNKKIDRGLELVQKMLREAPGERSIFKKEVEQKLTLDQHVELSKLQQDMLYSLARKVDEFVKENEIEHKDEPKF